MAHTISLKTALNQVREACPSQTELIENPATMSNPKMGIYQEVRRLGLNIQAEGLAEIKCQSKRTCVLFSTPLGLPH